jgi:hypothetical protein
MKINYNNKKFKAISNSKNGEVDSETVFHYQQNKNIISADYSGTSIVTGHLLGLVFEDGSLEFRYHHINKNKEFKIGKCKSIPKIQPNGKIILKETWQWLCDDFSKGTSIIEEI